METSPVRQMLQQALQNDQRLDRAEFDNLKQTIESDGKVEAQELEPLIDSLTRNQIDKSVIPAVIGFIAQHQESASTSPVTPSQTQPEAQIGSKSELKPEAKKEEPKSPWSKTYIVQGNFNHTSVSSGWTGQYGAEKTATRIEGSFQADVNYQQGKTAWKNRLLVEYGNTFVKGEAERAVSRNNLEFTSEAAYTIDQKGSFKIEVPYATFYTKGPLTEIDGRKLRETSGAKVTYKPNDHSETSFKVGAGFQQTHEPTSATWKNEFGVEAVIESKQTLGFMKAPIVKATGITSETVGFLDRLEANVSANAFNPLQNGLAVSNTDVGIKVGARYYLTDKKNIWLGASQQYEYGGQANSTWERKFSADAGFKFD